MPNTSGKSKPGRPVAPERAGKVDLQKAAKPPVRDSSAQDTAALLKSYGITTVPRPVYEWGGYRYSNPGDAIAAAKRGVSA